MQALWTTTSHNLKKILPEHDFSTWIEPIQFINLSSDTMYLAVPTYFFKEWLEEHYLTMFTNAVAAANGSPLAISLVVEERISEPVSYTFEEPATITADQLTVKYNADMPSFTPLNKKYTFDLFVNGTSNQFAYAAARAVAESPAETYNPLFIYGGVGLGKSHLLNAIGHYIQENRPNSIVCYCSAEKFMFEMVNALQKRKMDAFRERFRNVDVLLIDDIQFISGKTGTQ